MSLLYGVKKILKAITLRIARNGAGFTLIEALVVIFVIGTISTMMIVNWRKNEGQYQLQRAAQEIVQTIRKAQDYALSGSRMDWPGYPDGRVPKSYGVQFEVGRRDYFIYGDCIGNVGYQNPEDLEETYTQIETGIEIDSLGRSTLDVIFSIPDGFVSFNNPPVTSATITIKKTGKTCPSAHCRIITVMETGEINIQ
jgi:type II secretory pathway pseudopilin PulG